MPASGKAKASAAAPPAEDKPDVSVLIDEGKKAIALKEWEAAVEKYAEALDLTRDAHGESAPVMAPLLLSYGKSLFEIAVSQQGVLGREELAKEQITKTILEKAGASSSSAENPAFQFSESVETEEGESVPAPAAGDDDGEDAEGAEDEEPEDEFGEAWEVVDLARAIYEKQLQEDKEAKVHRELGDCHLLLGDISLETENLPQAAEDFEAALKYLTPAVPFSDPIIAETHYKLALVHESSKDKRNVALEHVQKAIKSTEARMEQLGEMEEGEREKERKRLETIQKELAAKLEDLKTAPATADPAEETIAHLMGVGSSSNGAASAANGAVNAAGAKVNDLTSMVKKKTKPAAKEAANATTDAAKSVAETTKKAAGEAADATAEVAKDAAEKGKEVASSAADAAVDMASSAAQATAAAAADAGQALAEKTADAIGAESSDVADISKELLHKAEQAAASGFAAVKALAQNVADQVMAEGVEAMQGAMRDVTETAQDALDGIEAAAAAGKEKVAEFQEEPVVGEKRKPDEEAEAEGGASKKARQD